MARPGRGGGSRGRGMRSRDLAESPCGTGGPGWRRLRAWEPGSRPGRSQNPRRPVAVRTKVAAVPDARRPAGPAPAGQPSGPAARRHNARRPHLRPFPSERARLFPLRPAQVEGAGRGPCVVTPRGGDAPACPAPSPSPFRLWKEKKKNFLFFLIEESTAAILSRTRPGLRARSTRPRRSRAPQPPAHPAPPGRPAPPGPRCPLRRPRSPLGSASRSRGGGGGGGGSGGGGGGGGTGGGGAAAAVAAAAPLRALFFLAAAAAAGRGRGAEPGSPRSSGRERIN